MRIIIIGLGAVGEAFAKILQKKEKEILKTFGFRPCIVAVADRSGAAVNSSGLSLDELFKSKKACGSIALHPNFKSKMSSIEVIERVDADVVVEVTPTNIVNGEPGLSHIMAALKRKRHVITTNKGPLALALPALMELAAYNRVFMRFSGTVGGGTPILDLGRKCLLGDKILSIRGILNGTTNYILTRMDEEGVRMNIALKEAQKKGYAEADPSYDLKGFDAACKVVIMANWLMGKDVTIRDVDLTGITEITLENVEEAKGKGCSVKLIASIEGKEFTVKPQLIPRSHPLCVWGTLNAVTFKTEYAGEVTIVGKGAGGMETGGAVLRDLIEIKREISTS
ncbi:MAG: homoserine dehydrogenase [Candidatus Bathyarchaeota archaeon]